MTVAPPLPAKCTFFYSPPALDTECPLSEEDVRRVLRRAQATAHPRTCLVQSPTGTHPHGTVVSVTFPSDAGRWAVTIIDSHDGAFVLSGGDGRDGVTSVPLVRQMPIRNFECPEMSGLDAAVLAIWLTRKYRSPDVLNSLSSLDIDGDAARKDLAAILAGGPCKLSNGTVLYGVVDDVASVAQGYTEDPPPCVQAEAQADNRALRRAVKRAKRYEAKYRRYKAKAAKAARYKQAAKHHRAMHAELRELTTALIENIAVNVDSAAASPRPAADSSSGDSTSGPIIENEPKPQVDPSSFDGSDTDHDA